MGKLVQTTIKSFPIRRNYIL